MGNENVSTATRALPEVYIFCSVMQEKLPETHTTVHECLELVADGCSCFLAVFHRKEKLIHPDVKLGATLI